MRSPGKPPHFHADTRRSDQFRGHHRTLREWHARFRVRQMLFDPFQMAAVSQTLARERMPIEEYAHDGAEFDGGDLATCST